MKQSGSQKAFGPKHKGKTLLSSDASKLDTQMMTYSAPINNLVPDVCAYRTAALNFIMEALTSGHNNTVGVWEPESPENADLLDKISRRCKRDGLFDVVVMARVTQEPNYERIQDEIAESLGFKFDHVKHPSKRFIRRLHVAEACCLKSSEKDVAKRAKRLRERILMKQRVLVILRDLHKGLDLETIGIPSAADHTGCKLLLTSASHEVLAKQMHAQITLKVY